MAQPLVSVELWSVIEPLIPKHEPSPQGGRPPIDDRCALTGILFVLKSGIPWEMLPQEMGCGSGMTCWRRLRDWQAAHAIGVPFAFVRTGKGAMLEASAVAPQAPFFDTLAEAVDFFLPEGEKKS